MRDFLTVIRRFAVGLTLILLAIAILLWSDPKRIGAPKSESQVRRIAVVNFASTPILEEAVEGLIAGLADQGYQDGQQCSIRIYNAEGDLATASLIAKELVGENYDLLTTVSTPTLQAVAAANLETKVPHVFTLTTDPWGAGIGVSRDNPLDHPPYMTGYGSLQPVASLFKIALQCNPNLKRVGVVWNPSESNSESSTLAARKACEELGIELLEATVDTSSGVVEAVKSLITRDVQAIWSGGDSTVAAARDAMVATTTEAGIPVFTNMPRDILQGVFFAMGADYDKVAFAGGVLAGRVLNGESPKDIPVENMVPEVLAINMKIQGYFSKDWKFKKEWETTADLVIDDQGTFHENQKSRTEDSAESPSR